MKLKNIGLILALCVLCLSGCAWMGKQVDYATACQQDAACLSDAKAKASLVSTVVAVAYPPAAGVAGAAVLMIALWWGGKKKEEKK